MVEDHCTGRRTNRTGGQLPGGSTSLRREWECQLPWWKRTPRAEEDHRTGREDHHTVEDHLTWRGGTTSLSRRTQVSSPHVEGGPPVPASRTQARAHHTMTENHCGCVCARGTVEEAETVCKQLPAASGSWGAGWGWGGYRGDQTPFL